MLSSRVQCRSWSIPTGAHTCTRHPSLPKETSMLLRLLCNEPGMHLIAGAEAFKVEHYL